MLKRNVPKKLWDHCLDLESRIRSATTLPRFDLDHQTPEAKMHGMSTDISEICEFEFYEWVMFNESQATFHETKFHVGLLGRCFSIFCRSGQIPHQQQVLFNVPRET